VALLNITCRFFFEEGVGENTFKDWEEESATLKQRECNSFVLKRWPRKIERAILTLMTHIIKLPPRKFK
jgi:hypothetical protein